MQDQYFELIMLIERLHRLFLDVIKVELDRMKVPDINNIQSMILYNVGRSKLTIGEISNRGYYLGSNVTYNLKKLISNGYLVQEQSVHDRRSSHVRLSDKGLELFQQLEKIMSRHIANLPRNNIEEGDIKTLLSTMGRLADFWSFMVTRDLRF